MRNKHDFNRKKEEFKNKSKYDIMFNRYFMYLYNLAITRFEWVNLPTEIVPKRIEEILFWNGQALFLKEDVINMYGVFDVALSGNMDVHGVPNIRNAYGINYNKEFDKKNSVILYDSMSGYPLADYLMMYADSLANMRLTRDINIYAQRTPITFAGEKEQELTVRNLFKQYNDFIPFIAVKNGLTNLDNLKVLKTDAPIVFDKINVSMKQEIVSALTLMGIDATDTSKKERMISDETSGNNGECEMNRNSALAVRKRACEQINRIFGLELDVKFRSKIPLTEIEDLNVSCETLKEGAE